MVLNVVNHFEAAREFQRLNVPEQADDKSALRKWKKGQEARLLTDNNELLTLHPPELNKSPVTSELGPEDHRSEERRPHKEVKAKRVRKLKTVRPPKLTKVKSHKHSQRVGAGDSVYRVKSPWHSMKPRKSRVLKPVPQKSSEKTRSMIRRDRSAVPSEEITCFSLVYQNRRFITPLLQL